MVVEEAAAAAAAMNKVVVVEDEMGEGMQCSEHPYRTNPGGICAFCLQDKLGKLLTSSSSSLSSSSSSFFPTAVAHSSDTSSPAAAPLSAANPTSLAAAAASSGNQFFQHRRTTRHRFPSFGFTPKKKEPLGHHRHAPAVAAELKRSKSTAVPHHGGGGGGGGTFLCQHEQKKAGGGGFLSFLYFSRPSSAVARKANHQHPREKSGSLGSGSALSRRAESTDESESPNASSSSSSFGRKVSRSRSVGCGSRSFSGDFFERISTGFGDCTLRRVKSQREPNPRAGGGVHERVRCGGIFSGFILSSSSYLASTTSGRAGVNRRSAAVLQTAPMTPAPSSMAPGRNRNWGWALTSPMRAFGGGRPSSNSKDGGRRDIVVSSNGNMATATTTPNLAAIPSLLTTA